MFAINYNLTTQNQKFPSWYFVLHFGKHQIYQLKLLINLTENLIVFGSVIYFGMLISNLLTLIALKLFVFVFCFSAKLTPFVWYSVTFRLSFLFSYCLFSGMNQLLHFAFGHHCTSSPNLPIIRLQLLLWCNYKIVSLYIFPQSSNYPSSPFCLIFSIIALKFYFPTKPSTSRMMSIVLLNLATCSHL